MSGTSQAKYAMTGKSDHRNMPGPPNSCLTMPYSQHMAAYALLLPLPPLSLVVGGGE